VINADPRVGQFKQTLRNREVYDQLALGVRT
jgi:hypothetical protein